MGADTSGKGMSWKRAEHSSRKYRGLIENKPDTRYIKRDGKAASCLDKKCPGRIEQEVNREVQISFIL